MKLGFVLVAVVLTLCACTDSPQAPTARVASTSTMPPNIIGDCGSYRLLDDKCTKEWYECTGAATEHGSCSRAWESCCTLSGAFSLSTQSGNKSPNH
jgi:hypothetical protein